LKLNKKKDHSVIAANFTARRLANSTKRWWKLVGQSVVYQPAAPGAAGRFVTNTRFAWIVGTGSCKMARL
jgi:hypothetical protein